MSDLQIAGLGPKAVIELTANVLPWCKRVWWHGQPGIGKTECADVLARVMGLPIIKIPPLVTLESVDIRGLPANHEGRTGWLPPKFWPTDPDWKGIIFADEANQGTQDVMCALSQLTQSYHCGDDLKIPPGALWLFAGNRVEDRAGAKRVVTQMLNRFLHLDFVVSVKDWTAWALESDIEPDVVGFVNFCPDSLQRFDPSKNERAFGTPRAWKNVSDVTRAMPEKAWHGAGSSLAFAAVSGLVGAGDAAQFLAFRECKRELPDLDKAAKSPETTAIPTDNPMVMYQLCCSLGNRMKELPDADKDTLEGLVAYARRFPDEYSALALQITNSLLAIKKTGIGLSKKMMRASYLQWMKDHKDVMMPKGGA